MGVIIGLLAGWYGGLIDELIMRLVDIELALPLIMVALVMVIALGQSMTVLGHTLDTGGNFGHMDMATLREGWYGLRY